MENKKGMKGFMAIKVDLEKVHDRLSWDFLADTIKDIGLSDRIITVIMRCISSCRMRISWNGDSTDEFSITKGIRQGDPSRLIFFVFCMDRLAHIIDYSISLNK